MSSNIAPAPGLVSVQERDAIDLHHHQQQTAAAVLGRGTLGLAKWLAMTTLFHGALLAGLLLLGLAAGVVGRVDGWIRQHNISPSLLIAVTAWLSYSIAQETQKQKTV